MEWSDPIQKHKADPDLTDADEFMRADVLGRAGGARNRSLSVGQRQHDLGAD